MLNKIEIIIENRVSVVNGSLPLYIDGHVPHSQCLKANVAIRIFFSNKYETLSTLFPR